MVAVVYMVVVTEIQEFVASRDCRSNLFTSVKGKLCENVLFPLSFFLSVLSFSLSRIFLSFLFFCFLSRLFLVFLSFFFFFLLSFAFVSFSYLSIFFYLFSFSFTFSLLSFFPLTFFLLSLAFSFSSFSLSSLSPLFHYLFSLSLFIYSL